MTPSPIQSPKENKLKLWPKYMYYNVHCTNVVMYISDFLQNLSKMFQTILNSAWLSHAEGWKSQTLYTTELHAATREGYTGDSDL